MPQPPCRVSNARQGRSGSSCHTVLLEYLAGVVVEPRVPPCEGPACAERFVYL